MFAQALEVVIYIENNFPSV